MPFGGVYLKPLVWVGNDRVISSYSGSSAAVWQIEPLERIIAEARRNLEGRELTENERRLYFLD